MEADIEVLLADSLNVLPCASGGVTRQDAKLLALKETALQALGAIDEKEGRVVALAKLIASKLGNSVSYEDYGDFGFSTDVQRAKAERNSNVVSIGDLTKGACRHRAFLFKFLCDQVGLECGLHRSRHVRGAHVGHAWNTVYVEFDKVVVVDLMHSVGAMYPDGSDEARRYARMGAFAFSTL